jgi:hypothetical protein
MLPAVGGSGPPTRTAIAASLTGLCAAGHNQCRLPTVWLSGKEAAVSQEVKESTVVSIRAQVWLPYDAVTVWSILGRPEAVAQWFPSIAASSMEGRIRTCRLDRGGEVVEEVVTLDEQIHRLQYRVLEGIPVDHHLATVDVIGDGPQRCVVVYSTDVEPARLAKPLLSSIQAGLQGLTRRLAKSHSDGRQPG